MTWHTLPRYDEMPHLSYQNGPAFEDIFVTQEKLPYSPALQPQPTSALPGAWQVWDSDL